MRRGKIVGHAEPSSSEADLAVFTAIKDSMDKKFTNEAYVGTLKNDGAYLAPFHDWDSKIPAETKAEIEKLKADIEAGTIKVES